MMSEYTASDAADRPVTTDGPDGPRTITGAVWATTDVLLDLQREADTFRNLYPEGGDDQ